MTNTCDYCGNPAICQWRALLLCRFCSEGISPLDPHGVRTPHAPYPDDELRYLPGHSAQSGYDGSYPTEAMLPTAQTTCAACGQPARAYTAGNTPMPVCVYEPGGCTCPTCIATAKEAHIANDARVTLQAVAQAVDESPCRCPLCVCGLGRCPHCGGDKSTCDCHCPDCGCGDGTTGQ